MTERDIFEAALALADPEQRRAYLDHACAGDPSLREHIEGLLHAEDQMGSFLESPAPVVPATETIHEPARESPGTSIGPYKLLQKLGEGGMGTVFLAEQEQPVKRRVALKIIKPGMDSAHVLARFEAERQALAMMDHPNIAKVLDANATAEGRPYFVMELVKGVPITKYCDQEQLSPQERLELFIPVCQAVQHAHQKGIIHRDLKPSNVLIALYDGKPIPKVIDFGVAKATGPKLTERTMFTEVGQIVGTLEYMAPEQAELNNLDIDTRADIYSLGVLLYELLTGSPPFTGKELRSAAFTEMLRIIREVEPPKPSTKLSSSEELPAIAARRKLEPKKLTKLVHGDLDWIVMKCLEKERGRRYETANGLALEIQRYLADEPVLAGPPSVRYRLRKFVRKHRRPVVAALAIVLLLVGGVVGTSLGFFRAERLREIAEANEDIALQEKAKAVEAATAQKKARREAEEARDHALKAEKAAKQSAEDTKAVLSFFEEKVLSAGRPKDLDGGLGPDVKLIDAVNQARADVAGAFKDRPLVEAWIRHTLGLTYWYLGNHPEAIRQYERALALCEANLGTDEPEHTLAARSNLASAYLGAGRIADAIRLQKQTLKQREAKLGPDHPDTLVSRNNLANAYFHAGRVAEAIPLFEHILKQREAKLGVDHPDTLLSRNNLASAYWRVGRVAEAIPLHEQNLKLYEAKLGPDHPDTLRSRGNLAVAYGEAGRMADAIPLFEQTLKQREAKLGPNHPATLGSRHNLAAAYWRSGRVADAFRLDEQTLKQMEAKLGADHPDTIQVRTNLATGYLRTGRTTDAIRLLGQALKQAEAKLGPEHPHTIAARDGLANAYDSDGKFAKAEPLYRALLKQAHKLFGTEDTRTAGPMALLGANLLHQQKYAEAEPFLRRCLTIRAAKQTDDWATFNVRSLLGGTLLGQKKYADAEPLLLQGYQGMKQRESKIPPPARPRLTEALQRLVQLYEATGKMNEAARWRKELSAAKSSGKK